MRNPCDYFTSVSVRRCRAHVHRGGPRQESAFHRASGLCEKRQHRGSGRTPAFGIAVGYRGVRVGSPAPRGKQVASSSGELDSRFRFRVEAIVEVPAG